MPNKTKTVGILGGTFDPPHRGHLALARAALDSGQVARVLLIPTHAPPHKSRSDMSPPPLRLAMTKLLATEDPRLSVSEIELRRSGVSFTIDTVQTLQTENPDTTYRLIIGADMALIFGQWRAADALARLAPPLVVARPGSDLPIDFVTDGPDDVSPTTRKILDAGRISMPVVDLSSTHIRRAVCEAADTLAYLTPAVAAYVREQHLYAATP